MWGIQSDFGLSDSTAVYTVVERILSTLKYFADYGLNEKTKLINKMEFLYTLY